MPGTTTAHQLVQAIRQKCSAEEVLNILNDLPNPENDNEMVEMTYNPLKIDVFVQTLLNLGSKSFSHSFAAIAKFHQVFKVRKRLSLDQMSILLFTYFLADYCRLRGGSNLLVTQFVRAVEQPPADVVRAG